MEMGFTFLIVQLRPQSFIQINILTLFVVLESAVHLNVPFFFLPSSLNTLHTLNIDSVAGHF